MYNITGDQAPKSLQHLTPTDFEFRVLNANSNYGKTLANLIKNHSKKAEQLSFQG